MSSPNPLEYDEEDDPIFGGSSPPPSDGPSSVNRAAPIRVPSRPSKEDLSKSYNARERAEELRKLKIPKPFVHGGVGPISLKKTAQWVAKTHARNITHIGYLQYKDVSDVINELPMKQIAIIEENSPHIKKDTDWLWESFLLQDYPIAHEQSWIKKGERRTSGWRRMYQKAKAELEERKARIAKIASESTKRIQEEREARQIGTTDRSFPTNKVRKAGHHVQSHSGPRPGTSSAGSSAVSKAFATARKETQRARIAMTHASGQVHSVPSHSPARPREKVTEEQLFRVPSSSSSSAPKTSQPLAPPRSTLVPSAAAAPAQKGSALRQRPAVAPPMEIRKADVPGFTVPKETSKRSLMDAFGSSSTSHTEKKSRPSPPISSAPRTASAGNSPAPRLPPTNGIRSASSTLPNGGFPRPGPPRPPAPASNGLFIPKKKPRTSTAAR